MPFEISVEQLSSLPGIEESPSPKEGATPASALSFVPTPLKGVEAQVQMPAVIGAGVRLARLVLFVAAGSIVVLFAYLVLMDLRIGSDVRASYDHILNPNKIGSEFYALGSLEHLQLDLTTLRQDVAAKLSVDSQKNADGLLKTISALPSVTSGQKDQLSACISLSQANDSRNEKLDRCLVTLENIRQAVLEAAASATNSQVAADSVNKINEHRQNLHTFWIQAAQLVLLNLLLPLLTALLGYIFGTQQAFRTSQ